MMFSNQVNGNNIPTVFLKNRQIDEGYIRFSVKLLVDYGKRFSVINALFCLSVIT